MQFINVQSAALALLLTLVNSSPTTLFPRQSSVNLTTPPPTLEPFLQFSATLSPQFLTSDISSHFGLFQYGGGGGFSGQVNGTVPQSGTLEIIYPGPYPPAQNGFATTTLILNTTCGVPLTLKAQGAVELGFDNSPAVKVVGGAFLQTLNEEFAYLNEKAFVFELCGGTGSSGNMGQATLYEIKSSLECTAQA